MPALRAIFVGNSTQLTGELAKVSTAAKAAGANIKNAVEGGGGRVNSGAMREALVVLREFSQGNFTRLPGSVSLLLQRLGLLKYILNPITGIVAGIAAGFFAAYKLSGFLVDKLSELKAIAFDLAYIPKHLKAINQNLEIQKEINKEIQKSIDLYNSAAKAAERNAAAIREHFEHLRKMNSYNTDPAYRDRNELEINKAERTALYKNRVDEQIKIEGEARKKQAESAGINTPSKEHDEELVKLRKKEAEEAKKFLDDNDPGKRGFFGNFKRGLGLLYNKASPTGVSEKEILDAESATKAEARRRIQAEKDAIDQAAANEELRKKKDEAAKAAGQAFAKSQELTLENQELQKANRLKDFDEAQELAMKNAAEAARETGRDKLVHGHVSSLQQIGAYIPGASPIHEIAKESLKELKQINQNTSGGRNGPQF